VGLSCDRRELGTPNVAQIFADEKRLSYYTARPIWTNEGSKRVISRKDLPFWSLNAVHPEFLESRRKTEIAGS